MKITIETIKLQELSAKAFKGSGRSPLLAVTMFMSIEANNGNLTLTTTDRINTLAVVGKDVVKEKEDFYTCVDSDLFNKLVSKTTSKEIVLEITDNCLMFKGNGVYSLPIAVDERNIVVRIPNFPVELKESKEEEIDTVKLKDILTYNKPSIAKTMEKPEYTGYYIDGEGVITYNEITACVNSCKMPLVKALIPYNLAELFSIITVEKARIKMNDKRILIEAGDVIINGALMEQVDIFPAEPLRGLISDTFESECEVNKNELVNALDRLGLFIGEGEKNAIRLAFGDNNLTISSKKSNGNELLNYVKSKNVQPFTELIDITDLKNQLQTQTGETVTLCFGNEKGLMLKSNKVLQLISYLDEEE